MGTSPDFYAEYTSVTGCIKRLVSAARSNLSFPPQISVFCDLCDATHNFRLRTTHQVATPGQRRRFDTHCRINDIEGIDVPE